MDSSPQRHNLPYSGRESVDRPKQDPPTLLLGALSPTLTYAQTEGSNFGVSEI